MKKIAAAASAIAAVICMGGCSLGNDDASKFTAKAHQTTAQTAAPEVTTRPDPAEMKALFKAPAEIVKIDTSSADPSTDEMRFVYDSRKRIVGISYSIDAHSLMSNYVYDDPKKSVKVVTMCDGVIVDERKIELPEFDKAAGFSEKGGYYFNGYTFD